MSSLIGSGISFTHTYFTTKSGAPLERVLAHSNDITDQQVRQDGARIRRLPHKNMLCSPSSFLRNHGPESSDPLSLSSGFWVHERFSDAFWGLSDVPGTAARCGCKAVTEHRIHNAHLVLHSIWNCELNSGKERQEGHTHSARFGRTPGLLFFCFHCVFINVFAISLVFFVFALFSIVSSFMLFFCL